MVDRITGGISATNQLVEAALVAKHAGFDDQGALAAVETLPHYGRLMHVRSEREVLDRLQLQQLVDESLVPIVYEFVDRYAEITALASDPWGARAFDEARAALE